MTATGSPAIATRTPLAGAKARCLGSDPWD